jgi:hypothetical protein
MIAIVCPSPRSTSASVRSHAGLDEPPTHRLGGEQSGHLVFMDHASGTAPYAPIGGDHRGSTREERESYLHLHASAEALHIPTQLRMISISRREHRSGARHVAVSTYKSGREPPSLLPRKGSDFSSKSPESL